MIRRKKWSIIFGFIVVFSMIFVKDCYAANKYTVYKDKSKSYKGSKSVLKSIEKVSSNKKAVKGTYPIRKGVILVTTTGKIANIVGHTAIVYSAGYIVESVEKGVVISKNNWKTRKKSIAGVTVRNTTIAQDAKVSKWCGKQKGKKYNYNYYNTNSKKSYYCSQLIWAGYKKLYKINLNTKAYDVGKKKAIGPYEFVSKKSSKIFPVYMKNWNR